MGEKDECDERKIYSFVCAMAPFVWLETTVLTCWLLLSVFESLDLCSCTTCNVQVLKQESIPVGFVPPAC